MFNFLFFLNLCSIQFHAEYRRFGLKVTEKPPNFENFNVLVRKLHGLSNISYAICYIDPSDNELLPINNDANFGWALKTAPGILRIIIQRNQDIEHGMQTVSRDMNYSIANMLRQMPIKSNSPSISMPHNFCRVSAVIDADVLTTTQRRVRLHKNGGDKSLGFYIRDGTSVRHTLNGLEKHPGIFISHLVPGGLAETTGLLAVNDEIVEVNGIEVAGKNLDQVGAFIKILLIMVIIVCMCLGYRHDIGQ